MERFKPNQLVMTNSGDFFNFGIVLSGAYGSYKVQLAPARVETFLHTRLEPVVFTARNQQIDPYGEGKILLEYGDTWRKRQSYVRIVCRRHNESRFYPAYKLDPLHPPGCVKCQREFAGWVSNQKLIIRAGKDAASDKMARIVAERQKQNPSALENEAMNVIYAAICRLRAYELFIMQQPIVKAPERNFVIDFAIRSRFNDEERVIRDYYAGNMLFIEVDGAYWHSRKERIERDKEVESFLGDSLFRIAEQELQSDIIPTIERLMKAITKSFPEQVNAVFK